MKQAGWVQTVKWTGALIFWGLLQSTLAHAQSEVTVLKPVLPSLSEGDKAPDDSDSLYCRPPQKQSYSRLLGPKVCLTNRQWADLHAQGLDMSADGKGTVQSEKYRTLHSGPCNTLQDSCY
jgi:hypothetical protein